MYKLLMVCIIMGRKARGAGTRDGIWEIIQIPILLLAK